MEYNNNSWNNSSWIILLLIIPWLLIITIFLILVGLGKINAVFGPTGPTGMSGGPVGPTGPTGPSATTMINQPISNPMLPNNGIVVAQCNHCQFYSLNADISNYQVIPGKNALNQISPSIVRFVLNTNTSISSTNGVFTLPAGTYQVSTTIVYPLLNSLGNNNIGGMNRFMGILLTDNTFTNVITDNFLIAQTGAIHVVNNNATVLSLNVTFTVTMNRNKLSVITWTDAPNPTEIGSGNGVASTFNLIKL